LRTGHNLSSTVQICFNYLLTLNELFIPNYVFDHNIKCYENISVVNCIYFVGVCLCHKCYENVGKWLPLKYLP